MPGRAYVPGEASQGQFFPTGNFFAATAPGLEPLTARELRDLGISLAVPKNTTGTPQAERHLTDEAQVGASAGGVAFSGSLEDLYKANLHLRTASRVLVRLGDFYAAGFPELRKRAGRLPWEGFLFPGQPVSIHVTCHKSRLYHSGAVAERILAAIGDRLGKPSPGMKASPTKEEGEGAGAQMVVVRLVHDHCTISMDSSGELLHRRGYRLATAKAPLRETLAAAILLAAGWDRASPLIDPFCGSGTIAIEAAMLAMNIPPGLKRSFAFMNWPGFRRNRWDALLAASQSLLLKECPPIQASDRDAGAIRLAQANAERAGVIRWIEFTCQAVSAIEPPRRPGNLPGWVVTNPPYGIRVSPSKDLRNLYAQIGNVLRGSCPGWRVAILCNDLRLLGQTRISLDTSFSTVNGGVNVRLARGIVETK
jgi:putative N6-adenine-specific DNA methylase